MEKEPVGWPSALVAIALLAMISGITMTAIISYEDVEDALKIWTAMTAVIGVVTGAFVTYFFTRGSVQEAKLRDRISRAALAKIAGRLEPTQFNQLLADDPEIRRAFDA